MSTRPLRAVPPLVGAGVEGRLRDEFRVAVYGPSRDDPSLAGPLCSIPGCQGAGVSNKPPGLCTNHAKRAKLAGMTKEQFIASPRAADRLYSFGVAYDFSPLSGRLRAEMQYALQCRHDRRTTRVDPFVFQGAVRVLAAAQVPTVMARSADDWYRETDWRGIGSLLRFTRTNVELAERPEDPMQRDFWVADDFYNVDTVIHEHIRFDSISQMWLRDVVRRWAHWRLDSGRRWKTVHMNVEALRHFSIHLATQPKPVKSMRDLDREIITGFVTYLRRHTEAAQTISDHTSGLRLFLDEYRIRDDWGPPLKTSAVLLPGEVDRSRKKLPRPLPEPVARQIEADENLTRLPIHLMTMVLIGLKCGLRYSSVRDLPFDCLKRDPFGAPTLVYRNVKRKDRREIGMPVVHDEVVQAIEAQQRAVLERWPQGSPHLFPRQNANPEALWPMTATTINTSLAIWVKNCGIADPTTGALAKVTFHQFRHTFATRLLAAGASEYFVSQILDHEHTTTTRGYAMLADQTRREEFDRFSKVNNRGEVIERPEDPWVADAEWLKQGLNRAHVTLPNGYCGLPIQQTCEMRNACITCDPYFVTTPDFLPIHRQQLAETRRLIATAKDNGQFRMVEHNQPVEETLVRIINALEKVEADASL